MLSFFTRCLNVFTIVIILEQMLPITNNQATPYICFLFFIDQRQLQKCVCVHVRGNVYSIQGY